MIRKAANWSSFGFPQWKTAKARRACARYSRGLAKHGPTGWPTRQAKRTCHLHSGAGSRRQGHRGHYQRPRHVSIGPPRGARVDRTDHPWRRARHDRLGHLDRVDIERHVFMGAGAPNCPAFDHGGKANAKRPFARVPTLTCATRC